MHKTIQKPRIYKIENKLTKQENKNIKNNITRVIQNNKYNQMTRRRRNAQN